jgi:dTDP-glucose pyrophosphorylase
MEERFKQALISPEMPFKEALKQMNNSALQVLVVTDQQNRILGVVTDGDMRRGIVNNIGFNEPVKLIMNPSPKTILHPVNKKKALKLMQEYGIKHIPVTNEQNEVVGMVLWSDFLNDGKVNYSPKNNPVVIMAGGKGTRLDPFTKILPKPLIPIGDKPIIDVIMKNFKKYGFNDFIISLNYKAEIIKLYFLENSNGYNVSYTQEQESLGTAGALQLAKSRLTETFIVSNCDVILEMDFDGFLNYHRKNENDATIVGVVKNMQIPYGVIEAKEGSLTQMIEKPEYNLVINSGVYILEPKLVDLIPEDQAMDMPTLLLKAKQNGLKIGVYPISSNWFDVGQWEEYQRTLEYFKKVEDL